MEMVAGAGGWWNPPAAVVVTRTVLPGRRERQLETGVPVLPWGYVAAEGRVEQGGDEIRIKRLMVAAISRWGYGR
jgi:hypothetical protein